MWPFKKIQPTQSPSTTDTVIAISNFLIDDTGSDLPTPFKDRLATTKLDYSPESLKVVDDFINSIRNKIKDLSDNEYTKLMVRTGAYAGEVIRRNSEKKFIWATYDEVVQHKEKMIYPKDPQTFYLLVTPDYKNIYFPMAKAVKFMSDGPADNFEGLLLLTKTN